MSEEPQGEAARKVAQHPALWLVLLLTTATFSVGAWWKVACGEAYRNLCYNDIAPLYFARGLSNGVRLYLESVDGRFLEYPVLTGAVMQVAGWFTGVEGDPVVRSQTYFVVTCVLLLFFALVTTTAMWFTEPGTRIRSAGRHVSGELERVGPRAALMVAVAPVLMLDGAINWDLIAVAFTALALWAWSREAPLLAGVFLGLGASAKLYPLFILGPIVVLCARQQQWRALARVTGATVGAWLMANVPLMVLSPEGWKEFYTFSQERGVDFGSIWLAWANLGHGFTATATVNTMSTAAFLVACALVAVLAWLRPSASVAQLAFLVIAAFVLVNKVYSPQYALWLLPLAALARPRWPAFLLWQVGEVIYFVAIWRHLLGYGQGELPEGAIGDAAYTAAIAIHVVLTVLFAGLVVSDVVREGGQFQKVTSARVVV